MRAMENLPKIRIRSLSRKQIDALEDFVDRYDIEVNVGKQRTAGFLFKAWKQEEMKRKKGERYRRKMLGDAEKLIISMAALRHDDLISEQRRRGREETDKERKLKATQTMGEGLAKKLNPASSYSMLERLFPSVASLKGMDQRTPYHSLTADMHTKEAFRHFGKTAAFRELTKEEKGWAILGAHLHDIGKGHPDGRQEKEGRMQYVGHNKVSARLAAEILPEFDISEEGKKFVLAMVQYHDATLKMMDAFVGNDQPKGGQLGAYDTYISNISEMPGSETKEGLLRSIRLMFAFTQADVAATVSNETAPKRPDLMEKIRRDTGALDRLEQALPAIVEAVMRKRDGVQQAGIIKEGSVYRYKDYGEKKAKGVPAYDMKELANAFREAGIPPKALGIVQKTAPGDIRQVLGKAKFGPKDIDKIMREVEKRIKHSTE